jgi:oxygen-dependent protoporphyrinogen oxidase
LFSGVVPDESLVKFAERRLGKEAASALIDPMASGVFAGDPARMSLKSCFPRIHEIENEYGSLIRGMLRLQWKARREGRGKGPGPGPGGTLTSFSGGMSELINRLTDTLGNRLKLFSRVENIARNKDGYTLHLGNGEERQASHVVMAAPAWAQAKLLQDIAPSVSQLLEEIEYPPLSIVCLGYRKRGLATTPDGFGFLVPCSENRKILGTIIDSNVFPNRAPEGHVLLRSMVGGSRAVALTDCSDQKMIGRVRSELKTTLNIKADPEFGRVYRHEKAIPQYHVGHAEHLVAIESHLQAFPGLVLSGNAYRGVSLNDCVANAWLTAKNILN